MFERKVQGATGVTWSARFVKNAKPKRVVGLLVENLEGRALMATLAPIPTVSSPVNLGFQVPVDGGTGNSQTYTVTSDNPSVGAKVTQGKFLTFNITHASSGANDPAFTGTVTYQLFDDLTPNTTSMIEGLVNQGFYNNKTLFRVANNFPGASDYIIQGGSSDNTASGTINQPGFPFADEFVQQIAFTDTGVNNPSGVAGQLAMANSGPDTNGSQFFMTTGAPSFLDFKHTIFAQAVSGFDIIKKMTQVAQTNTTPTSAITITSATLSDTNPDGVIHIDTTSATVGQTAHVTVTAKDSTDNSTTTQTFLVNVVNSLNSTPERPFIGPNPVPNQVVGLIQSTPTKQGQTAIFQINAVAPTPGDPLTYVVQGGTSGSGDTKTFTAVQNATATVDATGRVTVVPNANFTGVINLLIGVRDNTDRTSSQAGAASAANYDTQTLTLTVNNGAVVNLAPVATSGTTNVSGNSPATVQLVGNTSNPQSTTQTLTYALTSSPQHGTVSNFDATKGTFLYTPNPDFTGNDTVNFQVTDVGAPTPNLTSNVATQTLVVTGSANTGAVRQVGFVLVVTPLPRTDSVPNTINVTQVNGTIQVTINGVLDSTQPLVTNLDQLVLYGSKADDKITVDPSVTIPATIDGGHGGNNALNAGTVASTLHGWFGQNTMTGGSGDDKLIGRAGRVRFRRSPGLDVMFKGVLHRPTTLHGPGVAPGGQFYRFVGNRLIPVAHPYFPQRRVRG